MQKIKELDDIVFDFLESYDSQINFQEKISNIKIKYNLSSIEIKNYLIFFNIYNELIDEIIF